MIYKTKEEAGVAYKELEEKIENHDCHLSPHDSCPCVEWRVEQNAIDYVCELCDKVKCECDDDDSINGN